MQRIKKTIPSYESQPFAGVVVFDPEDQRRRVRMNAPHLYQHFLDTVCKVGDQVTMYLTNKRPKRSLSQNNYYHLYLSLISLSSGHTLGELKAWAKGKFLTEKIGTVYGEKTRVTRSSADLKIGEFLEFLEKIEQTTKIPLPNTEPFNKPLSPKEFDSLKAAQKKIYLRLTAKGITIKKQKK